MKTLHLLLLALLASLFPLSAVPLPNPAIITLSDNYDAAGLQRGTAYDLILKGTFAGATVNLQYLNNATQTWDTAKSFLDVADYVHITQGSTARLAVSGATGGTSINVALFPCDPLVGSQFGGTNSVPAIVQENDGVMQTDTLVALNATSVARDCTGMRSVAIMPTVSTINGQVIGELSNDGTNWSAVNGYQPNNGGAATSGAISNSVGQVYQFATPAKWFRLRISAYTSGSITVQSFFRSEPLPKVGVYIGGSATGTSAPSVQGAASAGSTAVGNPVRLGVLASNNIGVRTSGQIADIPATLYGVPTQKPYSIPEFDWSYVPPSGGITSSAATVTVKAAAGAGLRNYVTSATLMTNGALGSATEFVILDGATVIYRLPIGTTGLQTGIDINFPTPLRSSANAALSIQSTVSTTGAILCNLQGYAAP